jgi:hypothetical protein
MTFLDESFSQIFIQKNHPMKKVAFGMFFLSIPNPVIKVARGK